MSNMTNITMFHLNASSYPNHHLCVDWPHCSTRELDTAGWLFEKKKSTSNLTVIPAIAVIIFIILIFLKFHKWYKESVRLKSRGDVEFGDDSDLNYGIIMEGDKEFCKVEIRSDTTSVYDTVNSFRLLGNGHATSLGATPGCHDTVTSYKSLLFQRGDPSNYDSVKSYKAFLKQVTQNKNLDVEVKLLENYPPKCKSVEHCYIVEEDTGPVQISKLKLVPNNAKSTSDGKKRSRYRRASGEPLGPMRKRSASNPTYSSSRSAATSLPSIHYSVSSDSSNEEDTQNAFREERKKAFEERCKKMSRSCSGSKLSKVSKEGEELEVNDINGMNNPKRKRHYSADGCHSKIGKTLLGSLVPFRISRAFQHELNNLRESISETDPKPEEHLLVPPHDESSLVPTHDESSSENPDSSPSSCNSSFSSDAIQSASEDDETKLITQISAISDCTTFNSNDLASSTEQLSTHSVGSDGLSWADKGQSVIDSSSSPSSSSHRKSSSKGGTELSGITERTSSASPLKSAVLNSSPCDSSDNIISHQPTVVVTGGSNIDVDNFDDESSNSSTRSIISNLSSAAKKTAPLSSYTLSHSTSSPTPHLKFKPAITNEMEESAEDTDNSVASNPRRVKRFHVTSVQQNDDLSSLKSDCLRNSSGGSGSLES